MSVPISQFIPPLLSLLGVIRLFSVSVSLMLLFNTSTLPGDSGDGVTSQGSPPWPGLYLPSWAGCGCGLSPGGMHDLGLEMVFVMLGRRHPLPTLPAVGRKSDSVLKGGQSGPRWHPAEAQGWEDTRLVCALCPSYFAQLLTPGCCCPAAQLGLALWDPTDCVASSVHGISQARILEWVAISFSRGSSWPRDRTDVSWIFYSGRVFTTELPGKPLTPGRSLVNICQMNEEMNEWRSQPSGINRVVVASRIFNCGM